MKYLLLALFLLVSCNKPKVEKINVYSAGAEYDLTSGTGSYYTLIDGSNIEKKKIAFFIPKSDLESIKKEYYSSGLDTVNKDIDFESTENYSTIYGKRSLLIKLTLNNGKTQQIGYSGAIASAPKEVKGFLTRIYGTCNRIKDSLHLRPHTW